MKKDGLLRALALPFAVAFAVTLIMQIGALRNADLAVSDLLYQHGRSREGNIFLVNIDQRAIDKFGPVQNWDRTVYADAVEKLNSGSERPAVIGLDVLFSGVTSEKSDDALAGSAGKYGNVVTASAAEFGYALEPDGHGGYRPNNYSVLDYSEPYDALAAASRVGHVNVMRDSDGLLRYHLLYITLPDGERVESFSLAVAKMYSEYYGAEISELPHTGRMDDWYLNFSSSPGDYSENVSIADIIDGNVSPERYAGKIVLIGIFTGGFGDSYLTAAEHAVPMYGVEFQANAIEALLRGDYRRTAPLLPQAAILFIFTVFATLFFRKRRAAPATLALVLCGAVWLILCRLLYDNVGVVLHVLWIPSSLAAAYCVCLAANYISAALEARRITSTFKRYLAPEVVGELLKNKDALELGGKVVNAAVLFVDVRGFTAMSESLPPETVVLILNRYLTLISDCIFKNGGTLDKFIGDAAMAFWGAPIPNDDPALYAARAAMDMIEGSKMLSDELDKQFGKTLSFGIGINMGDAVVGNIGSQKRLDYTAIGDTVNTASRLESIAPGGVVYISRSVADALGDRAETTSVGKKSLKGKRDGFEVLTLDRLK